MSITTFLLCQNDWVPNNPRLPVLLYRNVQTETGDAAARSFECLFGEHGWPARWRDGIYDYHHYHSTAHEVLGVTDGTARLELGGPGKQSISLRAGDVLVIPAGVGHRCREASADFLVVGAYPKGQDWDICRTAPSDDMRQRMLQLPLPERDPVYGADGPLVKHWQRGEEGRADAHKSGSQFPSA